MLTTLKNRNIYLASKPVDFRLSMRGLAELIQGQNKTYIHDGSIYVFYNKNKNKLKCLFWDRNGFALYYKALEKTVFNICMQEGDKTALLTADELQTILDSGAPALRLEW